MESPKKPSTPLNQKAFAFCDTETTGLIPSLHEVIEIAIVFDKNRVTPDIDAILFAHENKPYLVEGADWIGFCTKIKPINIETAQPKALECNGYTPERWADAPTFDQIALTVKALLEDAIIVGHNSPYDIDMISQALLRIGIAKGDDPKVSRRAIDTMTLAHEHLVPCGISRLNLDTVCPFVGVTNEGAHGALADTLRVRAVFQKLFRATWWDRMRWTWANRKSV